MELIKAPNDFLEKKVQPFDFATMDAEKISKEMVEMMLKYKGVGLASNQVGIDAVSYTHLTLPTRLPV